MCLGVAGLLTGVAARRLSAGKTEPAPSVESSVAFKGGSQGNAGQVTTSPSRTKARPLPELGLPKSTDTVESLLAIEPGSLYARLALWMTTASEKDIAAYWQGYHGKERSNDITDLVFINWSRINPQGAIDAVAGTKDEHHAWWAWASHDPAKALAAAIAKDPDRVNNVAWGIGEFNPQWLRDHIKEIPESGISNAMRGMTKWSDGENPLESLDFLKKNGVQFDAETFKNLARKDPWEAQDWLKENFRSSNNRYYEAGTHPMDILVNTLSTEHPEDLERMADQLPSGALKRKMEDALFDQLLKTDPDAALENARKIKAPVIAINQMAKVALGFFRQDPEKAFGMLEEIIGRAGEGFSFQEKVEYPNGSMMSGGNQNKVQEFAMLMMAEDPARTLDAAVLHIEEKDYNAQEFNNMASQWVGQDFTGFTDWVNKQSSPKIRQYGGEVVSNQLAQMGQYEEAIEWASSNDGSNGSRYYNILYQWRRADPNAAKEWLETAEMPETERQQYIRFLKDNQE